MDWSHLLLNTSRISRLLELGRGDLGVSEVTEWLSSRSAWLELWEVEAEPSRSRLLSPRFPISKIFRSFWSEDSIKLEGRDGTLSFFSLSFTADSLKAGTLYFLSGSSPFPPSRISKPDH